MKVLAALGVAMSVLLVVGVLAAADVVNLPGSWKEKLGFEEETPNPPCRIGLYRNSPDSPPSPAGHWQFEPETPRNQIEASAIAIGDTIYVVGGTPPGNLHRVVAYNTRTQKFSDPTQLPTGLNHVQAAAYDGKLYLAGGYLEGEDPTGNFWQYDPATKKWTKLASLPQPTAGGASVVIGDKLYVAGGAPQTFNTGPVSPYADLQIYDFKTGEWSFGPEMPNPRHHVGAAALGGDLYVAGGRGEEDHSLDTFERYDSATEEWESLPPLPLGAASPGLVAVNGKLVIVGGEDQNEWEDGKGWVTPSAWEYDPQTNRWTRLPDMKFERRGGGVAAVGNRVYAIGGSYCPGLKPGGPVGTHTTESLAIPAASRPESG
ncbi:MAG TPA: kelch repeat-containing protein [Solirubrobacterales bacterium]